MRSSLDTLGPMSLQSGSKRRLAKFLCVLFCLIALFGMVVGLQEVANARMQNQADVNKLVDTLTQIKVFAAIATVFALLAWLRGRGRAVDSSTGKKPRRLLTSGLMLLSFGSAVGFAIGVNPSVQVHPFHMSVMHNFNCNSASRTCRGTLTNQAESTQDFAWIGESPIGQNLIYSPSFGRLSPGSSSAEIVVSGFTHCPIFQFYDPDTTTTVKIDDLDCSHW
jgi:hypothetical protein